MAHIMLTRGAMFIKLSLIGLVSVASLAGCGSSLPSTETPAAPTAPAAEEVDMTPVGPSMSPPGDFVEVTWTDSAHAQAPRREIETTHAVKPTMVTGKKTQLFALPQSGGGAFTPADAAK